MMAIKLWYRNCYSEYQKFITSLIVRFKPCGFSSMPAAVGDAKKVGPIVMVVIRHADDDFRLAQAVRMIGIACQDIVI